MPRTTARRSSAADSTPWYQAENTPKARSNTRKKGRNTVERALPAISPQYATSCLASDAAPLAARNGRVATHTTAPPILARVVVARGRAASTARSSAGALRLPPLKCPAMAGSNVTATARLARSENATASDSAPKSSPATPCT